MHNTPEKKYHWSFYVLTPLLSTALTVLLIEAAFVVFYPVSFSIEWNMYFEADPVVGYKLKPNSVGHFQHNIVARTNSHGHRDDEVTLAKPSHVCRVLVLGDSFTVGANVTQQEAYPQVLERMLNQHFAWPVEVINAAVGGWAPFQYAQYYEHYGRDFNPDLVFVGFFVGNDAFNQQKNAEQGVTAVLGRRVTREAASSQVIGLKIWSYEHSHLARLVLNKRTLEIDRTRDTCQDLPDAYIELQRSRLRNHLKRDQKQNRLVQNSLSQILRIKEQAEKDSSLLVVALLPDENQVNASLQEIIIDPEAFKTYDFEMPQSMLVDLFEEHHLDTIDLLPSFRDDARCLYMNDTHWTPDGHRLAASVIYEEMIPMVADACGSTLERGAER